MNTSELPPVFFSKPSFQVSAQPAVLKGSARRALAAFDTGYHFSCSFFPLALSRMTPSGQRAQNEAQAGDRVASSEDGMITGEIDRLLARNLLPRFDDEHSSAPRRSSGFSPEAIELGALLVIVGVVLTKLFIG